MIPREETIEKKEIYNGRVLKFRVDTVSLPDGSTDTRELVFHPGGVGVVAMDDDGYVYMVSQFRKPYDEILLEIPAGKLEKGENPEKAALRELEEETGVSCKELVSLGEFYPSVGYTDEVLRLYLAKGITQGKPHPDDDEYVEISRVHISELVAGIMSGEIKDGKTIAAILKTKIYLNI